MSIEFPKILEVTSEPRLCRWTERDTMLYALGAGVGQDPLDPDDLAFVYEKGLRVIPTQSSVVSWGAGPSIESMGLNLAMCVHAQEKLEMHRPLGAKGEAIAKGQVKSVVDRGPGKGALITWQVQLTDPDTAAPIATLTTTCLARGDGGFGGPSDGADPVHAMPARAPDLMVDIQTRPDQALIYRLSGDFNPLHVDPEFAKKVGFERPILHGLCTYAVTCHAVLKAFASGDPTRMLSHEVRFSAPVLPGDLLHVKLWTEPSLTGQVISFEVSVPARDTVVIKGGKTVLLPT